MVSCLWGAAVVLGQKSPWCIQCNYKMDPFAYMWSIPPSPIYTGCDEGSWGRLHKAPVIHADHVYQFKRVTAVSRSG